MFTIGLYDNFFFWKNYALIDEIMFYKLRIQMINIQCLGICNRHSAENNMVRIIALCSKLAMNDLLYIYINQR